MPSTVFIVCGPPPNARIAGYVFAASYPFGRTTLYWTVFPATFFVLSRTSARDGTLAQTAHKTTAATTEEFNDMTSSLRCCCARLERSERSGRVDHLATDHRQH